MDARKSKSIRRGQPERSVKTGDKPIAVVPDQGHDTIERRRQIREAFHDSQSRTVSALTVKS